KDAGAAGVLILPDEDGGVVVKADIAAVGAAHAAGGADDDGPDHIALLDLAAGGGLAHGGDDHIADVAKLPLGAAQYADGLNLLGAGVVGHLQIAFFLNHTGTSFLLRLLKDFNHAPALVFGQGAGFHHAHAVTHAALVELVVGLQLIGSLDNLLIQRVGHTVGDGDHNG